MLMMSHTVLERHVMPQWSPAPTVARTGTRENRVSSEVSQKCHFRNIITDIRCMRCGGTPIFNCQWQAWIVVVLIVFPICAIHYHYYFGASYIMQSLVPGSLSLAWLFVFDVARTRCDSHFSLNFLTVLGVLYHCSRNKHLNCYWKQMQYPR